MKKSTIHVCNECGYEMVGFMGKCPECGAWGSLSEKTVMIKKDHKSSSRSLYSKKNSKRLLDIASKNSDRIITTISEFNRVMGGGIVKDSITIVAAKPGAGKSTLLLQIANELATMGYKVLYSSGEESESQIKSRSDRILKSLSDNLWVVSDNSMDNILATIEELDPDLVIVDSIQTFTLEAFPSSRAGSPTQTLECAYELVKTAKNPQRPRAIFLIGQMTKEDEIAGVRALEHLVDSVLIIEGESGEELRSLYATKNRYGSTGEMGFFNMSEEGMISLDNPSEYFMTTRDKGQLVSGSSIGVVREGTRPIILEIESLVSDSFTPYPSRIGECMKREQLNTLISILEQRGGIKLFNKNVVIKTTGGIRLKEQSTNLAVIMSIISSVLETGIPNNYVFISDVGLTGELKKVPSLESRLREVERMGFERAYIASGTGRNIKNKNMEIVELRYLKDVINHVFNKG